MCAGFAAIEAIELGTRVYPNAVEGEKVGPGTCPHVQAALAL